MQQEKHLITGPVGQLELALEQNEGVKVSAMAVICHPHPQHEGTMNNKVVTTLARTFHEANVCTVRFNYRGVGNSEGEYGHVVGEVEDCQAVINWMQARYPDLPLILAGFSFGAFIVYRVAQTQPVKQVFLIAPSVKNFSFQDFPLPNAPCIVVQGDRDEVVSASAVFEWVNSFELPPALIRLPKAGHFFHGQLVELKQTVLAQLVK